VGRRLALWSKFAAELQADSHALGGRAAFQYARSQGPLARGSPDEQDRVIKRACDGVH